MQTNVRIDKLVGNNGNLKASVSMRGCKIREKKNFNGAYAAGIGSVDYDTVDFRAKINATELPDGPYALNMWVVSGTNRSNVVTVYYNIDRTPPPPPYEDLTLSPVVNPTELKSGYGFTATVTVRIDTNIRDEDDIAVITKVLAYFPDDHYTNEYELVKVSSDRLNSIWEFPVSTKSKIGAKKWYVPVGFPDKTYYTVKFKAETSKSEVYAEQESSILIDGNMYEDFKTQAVYNN